MKEKNQSECSNNRDTDLTSVGSKLASIVMIVIRLRDVCMSVFKKRGGM